MRHQTIARGVYGSGVKETVMGAVHGADNTVKCSVSNAPQNGMRLLAVYP